MVTYLVSNLLATPITLCKGWQSGSNIHTSSLRSSAVRVNTVLFHNQNTDSIRTAGLLDRLAVRLGARAADIPCCRRPHAMLATAIRLTETWQVQP